MKYIIILLLIFFGCSTSKQKIDRKNAVNSNWAQTRPSVLLISIDGYRHDYTQLYNPPNLTSFIKHGTHAKGLIPIYPSKTFPNHYAIATGMYADKHGIISNHFYSRAKKKFYSLRDRKEVADGDWYKGIPLWVLSEQNKMLSASFFFVGSDANILGLHPHYYYQYDKSIPHDDRINQVIDWFNLDEKKRPHFVTLYFSDVDTAGHHYGPNSEETKKAVLKVDQTLGNLFEKLKLSKVKNLNIIIVSDHGMQTVIHPDKFQYLSDYIDLEKVIITSGGSHANIYVKDQDDIEKIYHQLKKMPHTRVYLRKNVPSNYHYSNNKLIGDIVLSAIKPHYFLQKKRDTDFVKNRYRKGTHGYESQDAPNMNGIFYAKGPNIKSVGQISSFENIHIYPMITNILGLQYSHKIDGKKDILNFLLK